VSAFFQDGRAMRARVPGTVARGEVFEDVEFLTGKRDGELLVKSPVALGAELLERGQQRFGIFCTPCHDPLGYGDGMIVQRGMKRPASFHIDRLREAPDGYFFDVITNGFGAMYDYADRIPPRDRWAIVAYVRALQLSQNAVLQDVPGEERSRLAEEGQ
jgi:mono/diheme cytochrome c family protein